MKEIRLHGRGGLGTVKAAETLVYAAVMDNRYGNSIPFFGFERQGAPVTAYVKLSDDPIRSKNRVYEPNVVIVLEPTIMKAVDVFEGIAENATLIINTTQKVEDLDLPKNITQVAAIDATKIALDTIGRAITNTVMLGAFVKATGLVPLNHVEEKAKELWGEKNMKAVTLGYDLVELTSI